MDPDHAYTYVPGENDGRDEVAKEPSQGQAAIEDAFEPKGAAVDDVQIALGVVGGTTEVVNVDGAVVGHDSAAMHKSQGPLELLHPTDDFEICSGAARHHCMAHSLSLVDWSWRIFSALNTARKEIERLTHCAVAHTLSCQSLICEVPNPPKQYLTLDTEGWKRRKAKKMYQLGPVFRTKRGGNHYL